MKTMLNVELNPPIQTFNNMAIPLSVLASSHADLSRIYIYQYGIPIFYYNKNILFDCPPFRQWDCFVCEEIDSGDIAENERFMESVQERLLRGEYVYAPVNERYIPQRKSYGLEDFNHDILIYGMHTEEKLFDTLACNMHGQYRSQTIPFSVIEKAFYQLDFEQADDLVFFKPRLEGQTVENLLQKGVQALTNYRICTSTYKFPNHFYGMEIYQAFMASFQSDGQNELDMRNFRLLYEQKQLISMLLNDLEKTEAADAYQVVLDSMKMAFNLAIKFNFTREDKLIGRLLKYLEQCRDMELQILPHLDA